MLNKKKIPCRGEIEKHSGFSETLLLELLQLIREWLLREFGGVPQSLAYK